MRRLAFASAGVAALVLLAWRIWPLSAGRVTGAISVSKEPVKPVAGGLDYLNFDFNNLLSGDSNMSKEKPAKPYNTGGTSPTPRGIANNNPLNIEFSNSNPWRGQIGSDGRFAIFETIFDGIRAAARIMKTYRDKYGLNTVEGIIKRWAPKEDDNPTEKYIAFVAHQAGVHPQSPLSASDYPAVVAAMIHFENGYNPYDQATIEQAVAAGLE